MRRLGSKSLVTQGDSSMRSAHVAETPPPLLKSKIVSISIMQGAHYNSHTQTHTGTTNTHTDTHTHTCVRNGVGISGEHSIKALRPQTPASSRSWRSSRQDGTRTWETGQGERDKDAGRHCQTFH